MVEPLPSGTVTLLFSDIEQSSRLWDTDRDAMAEALRVHNDVMRSALESHHGAIVKDKGDGYFAVFADAVDGVRAAVAAQRGLRDAQWPDPTGPLRVRMALHTGPLQHADGDYHGPPVNRVARLEGIAHGGQVVMSEATHTLVRDHLPSDVDLRDVGLHRLRGLDRPERVYQLVVADLPSDFPPLRSGARTTTPLPDFPNALIGRDADLAAVTAALETARLVTLLGPGGMGKTRLGVAAATHIAGETPQTAVWVDLSPLAAADDVLGAVATSLGVHAEGTADLTALIGSAVTEPTLLLLDNFEHVQDAAADIAGLMAAAPGIRFLVTSRAPLRVSGEQVYHLAPLTAAVDGEPPAAVELFYERAAGQGVSLSRTGAEAQAVHAICQRLDGLPLAIELVAAQTRLLGVEELATMLESSLDALGTGASDLPERQRTIRSTIDWSVRSLTETQRRLFAELSVFPAGATLTQMEAVASASSGLMDHLASLVDNSLVTVSTGQPGGTRFRQLHVLRDYAAELLRDAGEAEATMHRLVDHYVSAAPEIGARLQRGEQAEKELRIDHPNLWAAMWWSLDHGRVDDMVDVQGLVWVYWFNGDLASSGAQWVNRADTLTASAMLDWLAGFFAFQRGDYATSLARMQSALAGFSSSGDERWTALSQAFAGTLTEDVTEGIALLEAATDTLRAREHGVDSYAPLTFLSVRYIENGDLPSALHIRQDLLEWAKQVDYPILIAWSRWNLALALFATGDVAEADRHCALVLEQMIVDGYQEGIASGAELRAVLEIERGNIEHGVVIVGACRRIWETIKTVRWPEMGIHLDAAMATAEAKLGADAVAAALERGYAMGSGLLIDMVTTELAGRA